jgi:hypothetical protein
MAVEVVGLGPSSLMWNQTQSVLGLVRLVQGTKQGALHRFGPAVAGLGLAGFRPRTKHALTNRALGCSPGPESALDHSSMPFPNESA